MTQSRARQVIHQQAQNSMHSKEKVAHALQLLKRQKIIPRWAVSAEQAHNFLMMI